VNSALVFPFTVKAANPSLCSHSSYYLLLTQASFPWPTTNDCLQMMSSVVSAEVIVCLLSMFRDCKEMELEAVALDDDAADKLWDRSFQLCNIPIPH